MKRSSDSDKALSVKKLKKENTNDSLKTSSPKSILKKSTAQASPDASGKPKKPIVGKKKPKFKMIKGKKALDGEPKKSLVKSNLSVEQSENEHDGKVESDDNKVSPKKSFKKKPNDNSKHLKFKKNKLEGKSKPSSEPQTPLDKKEVRKKQKELRLKRREKEKGYVLPDKSKKIYEELRCKKCPVERRKELVNELFKVLSGKFVNSARSHELSRMTQWIIKLATPEVRNRVIEEIINDTVSLSKTKYANHIILCLLQDCDKNVRKRLLDQLLGNINQLVRNKFSAQIVEEFYSKYAKKVQKVFIRQELYSDLFRNGKNKNHTSLSQVLAENSTLKSAILKNTKNILTKLVDKPFALSTNLVTDVLYDYLQNCEDQDKMDLLEVLKTNIHLLFKTKSGNQIMMLLLWESTPKVKKHMVKELKAQVLNIAKSSGNVFLRSLFDSVDDTVLIRKAILPTILDNAEDLVKDINGKKVILYLVAHRDTTFFHPTELDKLQKAYESSFVKKDISLKEKELLAPCLDVLLDKIKTNPEFWFSDGKIGLVSQAILSKGSGEKLSEAFNSICTYIIDCVKSDNFYPIENPGVHMVLKKLFKHFQVDDGIESFPEIFIKMCDQEMILKLFSINRGCFLLAFAVETSLETILSYFKNIFKSSKVKSKLEKQESAGAQVLLKQLKEKNVY
ncbi:pumilio homolog 3 [Halyomorpha halys]|uniref:pumilio homolog 3 n=1 Tax=Halyomorpha halys TaxID=286706 RepID=UPI0006D4EC46|nr:pumilio homolog 3 [Halyomorpha halys]